MRALQEKICHYRAGNDEIILKVLSLNPDRHILLLFNPKEKFWTLMETAGGIEKRRFQLKNLLPGNAVNARRKPVSLFSLTGSSFGIIAGEEIIIWNSFRSKPHRVKLRLHTTEDRLFFESNPVVFVRAMDDGSLVLAHRTVFSEAYFFTIALLGTEGYTFSGKPQYLDPHDYRHLVYIASVPSIMDILPFRENLFIHTPGSFRNWEKYNAEGSILVQMNRQGGIIKSRKLQEGRGIFSSNAGCMMVKPFDSDSILYFYSLSEDRSQHLVLDDHVEWTPGTPETRFTVTEGKIAAWDSSNFILSAIYNMPDWCSPNKTSAVKVC